MNTADAHSPSASKAYSTLLQKVGSATLVAASKTRSLEEILALHIQGATHFGENRVEEAAEKMHQLPPKVRQKTTWHMLGHVQSRKAKHVVELFDWVDSVDSLEIAQKLSAEALKQQKCLNILIEVNISGETSKTGFPVKNWRGKETLATFLKTLEKIYALPAIEVRGLMMMAPHFEDSQETRPYFRELRELRETLQQEKPALKLNELSMGMSEDFEIAVEEGSTMVRLGRILFQPDFELRMLSRQA